MPLFSTLFGRHLTAPNREDTRRSQSESYQCDEAGYDKFGVVQKVRRIRFHPLILGIRGTQIATFEPETRELIQVFDLQGVRVSALDGKEFVITGPHLGGPWLMRAGSNQEARTWCQAFESGADLARSELRAANRKSEAECSEQYRKWVLQVMDDLKSAPAPLSKPNKAKLAALLCTECNCRYDEEEQIPRLLSCLHTHCQKCIQKLSSNGSIVCPACGTSTDIPDNDPSQLAKNFAILDIHGPHHSRFSRNDTFTALDNAGGTCPICFDPLVDKIPFVLSCGHSLCDECAYGVVLRCKDKKICCPECRSETEFKLGPVSVNYCLKEAVEQIIVLSRESRTDSRIAAQMRWTALRWALVAVYALLAQLKAKKAREEAAKPKAKAKAKPGAKVPPTAQRPATSASRPSSVAAKAVAGRVAKKAPMVPRQGKPAAKSPAQAKPRPAVSTGSPGSPSPTLPKSSPSPTGPQTPRTPKLGARRPLSVGSP